MKVKELIEKLKECPPESELVLFFKGKFTGKEPEDISDIECSHPNETLVVLK